MAGSERMERSRLKTSLKKLHALKPGDLVREDLRHRGLSFHSALPYFERTLGMFRARLWRGNPAKVPSAYLKIMADQANWSIRRARRTWARRSQSSCSPCSQPGWPSRTITDYTDCWVTRRRTSWTRCSTSLTNSRPLRFAPTCDSHRAVERIAASVAHSRGLLEELLAFREWSC